MRSRAGDSWSAAAWPLAALLAVLGLRVWNPPFIEDAQLRVFDAFQRLAPRGAADARVRIVDIDDETLEQMGQWPWPRTQIAALLRALAERGAGPIVFDLVFAEPDRTSPGQVWNLWPGTPELDALRPVVERLPDHDRLLAEQMASADVVTAFGLTAQPTPAGRLPLVKAGFAYAGGDPRADVPALAGAVPSLRVLEEAAKGNGHFTLLMERDGVTRRVPLLLRLGERLYPSLAAEALRVAQGASTYAVKTAGGSGERSAAGHTGVVSLKIGSLVIPTDSQGRAWVYYSRPSPDRTISARRVFSGDLPPGALNGCLVLIGASATGLKDIRTTPLDPAAPGTAVHAQLIEQALTGVLLRRPDWADGAEALYVLALGAILTILLPRVGAAACAWIGGASIGLAASLSWLAFAKWRLLLDPVFPSVAILSLYLVSSFLHSRRVEAERRSIRQAFGRYLSPVLVNRLAEHPGQLRLGGELKPMTLLFADVRGFTGLAERMDAAQLTRFMNDFLTAMTEVVLAQGGTIDKYVGDCIMAFWNAPLDDPAHARHACLAALAMRRRLEAWNRQRVSSSSGTAPVRLGLGINTGECCVGNIGSEQRFEYSALGDPVNLASRLEGLGKTYGVDIIVGASTRAAAPELAMLELDLIRVAGKTQPARIFALLGDAMLEASAPFRTVRGRHEEMLEAYRSQRWALAEAHLEACRKDAAARFGMERCYALYAERIAGYRARPPGDDWEGVFTAPAK